MYDTMYVYDNGTKAIFERQTPGAMATWHLARQSQASDTDSYPGRGIPPEVIDLSTLPLIGAHLRKANMNQ